MFLKWITGSQIRWNVHMQWPACRDATQPAHPTGRCTSLERLCSSCSWSGAEAHCLWMKTAGVSTQQAVTAPWQPAPAVGMHW